MCGFKSVSWYLCDSDPLSWYSLHDTLAPYSGTVLGLSPALYSSCTETIPDFLVPLGPRPRLVCLFVFCQFSWVLKCHCHVWVKSCHCGTSTMPERTGLRSAARISFYPLATPGSSSYISQILLGASSNFLWLLLINVPESTFLCVWVCVVSGSWLYYHLEVCGSFQGKLLQRVDKIEDLVDYF